eukprot:SAG31_NODE_17236_length_678_cov_1.029361_1_plen_101_part_00
MLAVQSFGQLPWGGFVAAVVTILAIRATFNLVMSRWHMAAPNEWLLLLQNGDLVKAGIGAPPTPPPFSFSFCVSVVQRWITEKITRRSPPQQTPAKIRCC